MGFRKVAQEEVDETRVTLALSQTDDGTRTGRVSTLAFNEENEVESMSMEMTGSDLLNAVAFATQLADFKEQDVDVFDPYGLWTDELGKLG